jgi:RNA polymerase sigma factor (sigma-70 family)
MAENHSTIIDTVRTYGRRLFAFIRGRVPTDQDAEDILQDVWYQLSNVVNTTDIAQMSGWLHKVARNKITDRYRKKQADLLEDYAYEAEDGAVSFRQVFIAETEKPENAHLKEVFWKELFAALGELPAAQREVFILNELEELTLREIAEQQGENIKTIISRKGYAVKHLRRRLARLYEEISNA